ncbi:hypothetical protein TWF191_005236 [Orbilia oligospora]|uniref:Major facilitator superfamily (MFS) profile domain-containing protein n=1 Tax=Orbilia oligospora TaxID=2813651 RepID=A0A7C8QVN6_ORBOL|nr:hypothetical protein TWF191_005236 [Orbilia oligospora]
MTTYQPPTPQLRKKILTTLFISLLLDLLSFTLILPLFPQLLAHYQALESTYTNPTLLRTTFAYLNSFKAAFSRPISSRFDVVLLGGAMGSLFSFLQAFSAPIIGSISDKSGRRTALLYSMLGNILSVLIWVFAVDFPTFVASRIVGGLSEGNVQLAIAIATDHRIYVRTDDGSIFGKQNFDAWKSVLHGRRIFAIINRYRDGLFIFQASRDKTTIYNFEEIQHDIRRI